MKSIILFITLILSSFTIYGQQDITGFLESNKTPISYASVILSDLDSSFVQGSISEASGNFKLEKVPSGSYLLNISCIGYEDYVQSIEIQNENLALGIINIPQRSLDLDQVSVVAKKPLFEKKIDRTVVNVQNSITSVGSDALSILEKSPGIGIDRLNNTLSLNGKNGVIITINGKRSRLTEEALLQMLEATPSANIKKIELINNPPASFDADGDGGVINIVMIKQVDAGLNGNYNLMAGYGQRVKYGGGLNFNYGRDRINIYGDFSTNNDYSIHNIKLTQKITYENATVDSYQENNRPPYTGMHTGRIGIDFSLSKKLTWSSILAGSKRKWDLDALSNTYYNPSFFGATQIDIISHEENTTEHFMISNNLVYSITKDKKLSFDYDYLNYTIDNPTNYEQINYNNNTIISNTNFNTAKLTPFDFKVIKADYSQGDSEKWKIDFGLKGTFSTVENKTRFQYLNQTPAIREKFTDNIQLEEQIIAAYVTIAGKLSENMSYTIGNRFESYDINMTSDSEGKIIDRIQNRNYPTATLSYALNDQLNFGLNYNERVNRPSFQVLAPAFYFLDVNTIIGGNINARPTISRTIGLDINYKTLFFNLSYVDEDHPIAWGQPILDTEENIMVMAAQNSLDRKLITSNISLPIKINEWWSTRINFNGMWRKEVALSSKNEEVERSAFSSFGNLVQNFKLSKNWSLETTSRYNSRIVLGLAEFKPRFSTDLGIQKTFDSGAKLSLNWNDIFNLGSFFTLTMDRPENNIFYDWNYNLEGNVFKVNWSMPFGKSDKKHKTRKMGSEEIRSRLN